MTKTIKILGQSDRIDLIRHLTKQRLSSGELYVPSFSSASPKALNQVARDIFAHTGHLGEHVFVTTSDTVSTYSLIIENDSSATISINKTISEQTPYLALHLTTLVSFIVLLRRYGPHRYSQEQEFIIASHASVLLGFGAIGINAYHENLPKTATIEPITVVTEDKYTEWFNDYLNRHQLHHSAAEHLLPGARKVLQLHPINSEPADPLLSIRTSAHKEKRQKTTITITVVVLTLLGIFLFWAYIPKPLTEKQVEQLERIGQANQAYKTCRDELASMSDVPQRDILTSRSLQAKHRSCETLRGEHNQLVKKFQAN